VSITPEQCRAARALLGWTQDDLEERSKVAKKAIADFERNAGIPYKRSLIEIEEAFEAGGVRFISENGGGVGLRLTKAVARLARSRVSVFDEVATLIVSYRDIEYRVSITTHVLDDMDTADHQTESDLKASLERNRNKILVRTARAIDAGRGGDSRQITLTKDDFSGEI
jgi:transcriptional regulator with XRE-family HTH domain